MFKSQLVSFHYSALKQGFAKTNFHRASLSQHITLTWERRSNWRVRVGSVCAWFISLNPWTDYSPMWILQNSIFHLYHWRLRSWLWERRKWNRLGQRKWKGKSLFSKGKYPAYEAKSSKEVCIRSFQKGILNGLDSQGCQQYIMLA